MNSTSVYGNSTLSHSFNHESMETGDLDSGEMDSTSINEVRRVMPDTLENDQVRAIIKDVFVSLNSFPNFSNWLGTFIFLSLVYDLAKYKAPHFLHYLISDKGFKSILVEF